MAEPTFPWKTFSKGLLRLRADRLDVRRGIRCGLVVLVPVVVGYLVGLVEAGVLVTMGALNLLFDEPSRPETAEFRVLLVGVFANAGAFALGTLLAPLPRTEEAPFVAIGLALILLPGASPRWQLTSFIAAVMFVLPLGIPPTAWFGFALRPLAILLGGFAALVVTVAERAIPVPGRTVPSRFGPPDGPVPALGLRTMAVHSIAVGLTAGAGLLIGYEFGLARDYWVLLTIIVALRVDLASTVSFSAARILGTVAGASVAFLVTSFTQTPWILFLVLPAVVALAFATRAVNYTIYALWVTIAIIVLLSLAYAGGPALAATRLLDTVIGGALALGAALLLWIFVHRPSRTRPPVRTPAARS